MDEPPAVSAAPSPGRRRPPAPVAVAAVVAAGSLAAGLVSYGPSARAIDDAPLPTVSGAVPAGYLGAWDGHVMAAGRDAYEVFRVEIGQGAMGTPVAMSWHLLRTAVCTTRGTLSWTGGELVLTEKLLRSTGPGCPLSFRETLRLRPDGKVDWRVGESTAVLARTVSGRQVVDASFLGTWTYADYRIDVRQGPAGAELVQVRRAGSCAEPALLVTVRGGLVVGPPRDGCGFGSGLVLSRQSERELLLTLMDGTGERIVLSRSG